MAKGQGGNEDRAKVKLRVIEFELEGGNQSVENSIRQLTHALTTRNGQAAPPKNAGPARQAKELAAPEVEGETEEYAEETEVLEPEAENDPEKARKASKPAGKPRMPQYLHDLDMTGSGVPFREFAAQRPQSKHTRRYLVAALWLRDHGNSPTITTDKVYTCYKTAGWPLNVSDWDLNFRCQIKTDRFRRVVSGEYAITPLGEEDLKTPDGTA